MFINNTVFILGAGASWHYGYPTGEDLVKKVIAKAEIARDYFRTSTNYPNVQRPQYVARGVPENASLSTDDIKVQWHKAWSECTGLITGLQQVNPLVIDYFLGQNPTLQPIGKLMIAWVILERDKDYSRLLGNLNRQDLLRNSPDFDDRQRAKTVDVTKYKDDWYRFIIHRLTIDCTNSADLLRNNIRFVTFNYDVSLEHALSRGLHNIELFKVADTERFFGRDRIIHVYGKVREMYWDVSIDWDIPWTGQYFGNVDNQGTYKSFLDAVYAASKGIRVIDPTDKESDKASIRAAKKAIKDAACIYILGYGFDPNNNKRLGLSEALYYKTTRKCVLFTNYNNSNRINKSASRVMFHKPDQFLTSFIQGDEMKGYYFEKSIRDTYEALELDFDPLEEQLLSKTKI
jgi:hypothetical protein